jgi:hypothetical protein
LGDEGLAPAIRVPFVEVDDAGEVAANEAVPELRLGGQRVEAARDEAHAIHHALYVHIRQYMHPHLATKTH